MRLTGGKRNVVECASGGCLGDGSSFVPAERRFFFGCALLAGSMPEHIIHLVIQSSDLSKGDRASRGWGFTGGHMHTRTRVRTHKSKWWRRVTVGEVGCNEGAFTTTTRGKGEGLPAPSLRPVDCTRLLDILTRQLG